jgi:ribonuclease/clavin/mitogillin
MPNLQIYKNNQHQQSPTITTALPQQQEYTNIAHNQLFSTPGATLKAFHSPGHTTDHMTLILQEESAMFTGDNVLGQGTAVFENLSVYLQSLQQMQHEFSGRAYPGHGPVIDDGRAKIHEYIRHRQEREMQIVHVLGGGDDDDDAKEEKGWRSMELVQSIYKDYPESLHQPAERGVLQVLEKLKNEGKVGLDEDKGCWFLLQSKPAL